MKKIIFLLIRFIVPISAQTNRVKPDEDAKKYQLAYTIVVDSFHKCGNFYSSDEYRYNKTGLTISEAHYHFDPSLNSKIMRSYDSADRVSRVWSIQPHGISDKQNSYNSKNLLVKQVATRMDANAQSIEYKTVETTYDTQDRRVQEITKLQTICNVPDSMDLQRADLNGIVLDRFKSDTVIYIWENDTTCRSYRLYMGKRVDSQENEILKYDVQKRLIERRYSNSIHAHYSYMLDRMKYHQNGDLIEFITYVGSPIPEHEWSSMSMETDEKGRTRVRKRRQENLLGLNDSTYYVYDSKDKLVMVKKYDVTGLETTQYRYNGSGQMAHVQWCLGDSCTFTQYTYNEKGLLKSQMKRDKMGKMLSYYAYYYGYWNGRDILHEERVLEHSKYYDWLERD